MADQDPADIFRSGPVVIPGVATEHQEQTSIMIFKLDTSTFVPAPQMRAGSLFCPLVNKTL